VPYRQRRFVGGLREISGPLLRAGFVADRRHRPNAGEFERTMALPGMVGAMLAGDGFLSLKRAERFRPILEAADRYGAIMLVHYGKIANDPEPVKIDSSDNGHPRVGTLDMQARLSQNMITFCLTDFLKSFPNVPCSATTSAAILRSRSSAWTTAP
jgi:hypothetical protein